MPTSEILICQICLQNIVKFDQHMPKPLMQDSKFQTYTFNFDITFRYFKKISINFFTRVYILFHLERIILKANTDLHIIQTPYIK